MNLLGIHLDFPSLKFSLLRKGRGGLEILENREISLKIEREGRHANPILPKESVRDFLGHFKGKIICGLNASAFFIRTVETNSSISKHIEETIRFQSEATSHLPPVDALTVPLIKKGLSYGLLYTALRKEIAKILSDLEEFDINPDAISTVPNALCQFIHWKFPKLENAFIVDIGLNEMNLAFMEKGSIKKSHSIPGGTQQLLSAFLEDRKKILLKNEIEGAAKQFDLLLLKPALNPNLSTLLKEYRLKLEQIYSSFTRGLSVPVIYTGKTDTFLHLRESLMDFSENDYLLTQEEQNFAISSGLAIEQTSEMPLQLRQEEFFPQKNWVKLGKLALCLMSLSVFLSIGLVWGSFFLSHKQKQKMFCTSILADRNISQKEMGKKLNNWIASIEKNNKEYPYIFNTPKVSNVLSWLSAHPLLLEMQSNSDPIEIHELKYSLEKPGKKNFKAKVDLEFSFKNSMNARRFHEALMEGDEMVNSNAEITWKVSSNTYRTSFYLKNGRL